MIINSILWADVFQCNISERFKSCRYVDVPLSATPGGLIASGCNVSDGHYIAITNATYLRCVCDLVIDWLRALLHLQRVAQGIKVPFNFCFKMSLSSEDISNKTRHLQGPAQPSRNQAYRKSSPGSDSDLVGTWATRRASSLVLFDRDQDDQFAATSAGVERRTTNIPQVTLPELRVP